MVYGECGGFHVFARVGGFVGGPFWQRTEDPSRRSGKILHVASLLSPPLYGILGAHPPLHVSETTACALFGAG